MFPSLYCWRSAGFLSPDGFLRRPRRSQRANLMAGLIAHWKMEEASGPRNDSVQNHHLTPHGDAMRVDGIVGLYATQFVPNTEDYLSYLAAPDLRMTGTDFTIAGWVFFDSVGECGLAGRWEAGSREYLVGCDGITLFFAVSADGSASSRVTHTQEVNTGEWYHFVAWVNQGEGSLNLTLNNGSVYSQSYSGGVFGGMSELNLGREPAGPTWLSGRLDSVSIWKRCLSAEERNRLYNSGAGLDYPFA